MRKAHIPLHPLVLILSILFLATSLKDQGNTHLGKIQFNISHVTIAKPAGHFSRSQTSSLLVSDNRTSRPGYRMARTEFYQLEDGYMSVPLEDFHP